MNKSIYVVIYPYNFTKFLWDLMELDQISKYSEVYVWDVSRIVHPNFSKNLSNKSDYINKKILHFKSLFVFITHLRSFLALNNKNNICILNEMPKINLSTLAIDLILYYFLKSKNVKIFDQFVSGIPISYPNDIKTRLFRNVLHISTIREFGFKMKSFIIQKLSRIMPLLLTHRLVAGRDWFLQASKNKNSKVKIIFGHSSDFSKHLISSKSDAAFTKKKIAILLDGAGPFFTSDSFLFSRKVFFTSDAWYPSLVNFFELLEGETGVTVEIAGHYKSNFMSPAPQFGYRKVSYGKTQEMVKAAKFVITRSSTAISYAVIYRKPVLFIYSNELSKDKEAMRHISGMAQLLGTKAINIDNFSGNLSKYLNVNEAKYASYQKNFLSFNSLLDPNFKIILNKIIQIELNQLINI